jgi:uncharacterized protein (DUF58 family)
MASSPYIHEAELAAASLPALLVDSERVAATVAQGIHGRRKKGMGDNFWQFRPYQAGENTRAIDWRQSAKSDALYVREREWEIAQTVWLWCDASGSMKYSGSPTRPYKMRRAEVLMLALASLIIRGGERIGLLGVDAPPGHGTAALHRLANILEKRQKQDFKDTHSLQSLPKHEHLPRHCEMVLIGDFLSPLDEIEEALKKYSRRHVRGHLLQVLDPAEETLPFEGRVQFQGLEKEGSIFFGNVNAVRDQYQERLALRRRALRELAHSFGWGFHRHTTDQSAESALLALYLSLSEGRRS